MSYRFLESGVEKGVEDVSRVVHGPQLVEDGGSDWRRMDVGEEVAEETTELLVELAAGTDRVALPVEIQSHILWSIMGGTTGRYYACVQ